MTTFREAVGPLAESLGRVASLDLFAGRLVTGEPADDRWLRLDDVVPGGVTSLFEDAEAQAPALPDYHAAAVASALAGAVVTATWPMVLLERRLPLLDLARTAAHRCGDALWLDRLAVNARAVAVLPDDHAVGSPGVEVVADLAGLHDAFVTQLVELLPSWFAAVRARGPFGVHGMWGQLADLLCSTATWTAHDAGRDEDAAWHEAVSVVDRLRTRVPALKATSRPFPVATPVARQLFQVRGTCCLWYKTQPGADPAGEGYCLTCPRRDDDVRRAGLAAYLEERAATAPEDGP